jgi:hypothetical protein
MRIVPRSLGRWLERPQASNRDAIVVGVVGGVLTAILLYGGGKGLDAIQLIDFGGSVPAWLAAVLIGAALVGGLAIARAAAGEQELRGRIEHLQARADELGAYDTYAEHVRDALADLRLTIEGELPDFSVRDFIENGVFQPAQTLLTRDRSRGEVRFSVLHPDPDEREFVMASEEEGLFPALGHRVESRQNFRLPIAGSFSALAFQNGRPYASGELSSDDRFEPHPLARPGREYESIVSVPLRSRREVDGVFNVIATAKDAFTPVDQTYIALLGSVIDVARAVPAQPTGALPPDVASS